MKISPTPVIKGVLWTVGFFVLSQSLRIVSSIILTRLLTPEIYGILVIVFVLRNGIELLSDVGFAQSLVTSKNADEPAFYNTVWSLRLVRCLILLPICVVAAFPVAALYQTPILGWILPVVGMYFVLGGLASLSPVFLQRRLQFARLNLFQFFVEAITAVSQIIFAYFSPTVWAVIFGGFVGAFANAVGTYLLMPGFWHRFYVSKEYAWQIFLFGRWIFISSAIFFVSSNFDSVYLGTVVPLSVLGVYGIARNIADSVSNLSGKINSIVIFPFIASHSHLPRAEFRKQLSALRGKLLLLAALGFSILVATADLLIQTLYDHRYQSAGWMLSVMIITGWFGMLCTINDATLMGLGKPSYATFSLGIKFVLILMGLPLAFIKYGIFGVIVFLTVTEIFRYIPFLIGQKRERFSFVAQDLAMTLFMLGLVALWEWLRSTLGLGTSFGGMLISSRSMLQV